MVRAVKAILSIVIVCNIICGSVLVPMPEKAYANVEGGEPSESVLSSNDEIIIKYKSDKKNDAVRARVAEKNKDAGIQHVKTIAKSKLDVVKVENKEKFNTVLQEYQNNPDVEYAHPNYLLYASDMEPNENLGLQWGLKNDGVNGIDIQAQKAWTITKGSSDLVIGVIDTGVDIYHKELIGNIYHNPLEIPDNGIDDDQNGYIDDVNGWDFANDDNSVFDSATEDTHGTHVSGIIAAKEDGAGIVGVAPNVKILPMKFIKGKDGGKTSDAIEAIIYAKSRGISIINCSWGSENNTSENFALKGAMSSSDSLFVCSAGNNGSDTQFNPCYPAAFDIPNIISVAAINRNGKLSSFSTYGNSVDVAAPGEEIYSTIPGNQYQSMNGTSMAAPHVTGILALLKSHEPMLGYFQLAERVEQSSFALQTLSGKVTTSGMVDAFSALTYQAPNVTLSAPQNQKASTFETTAKLMWDEVWGAEGYDVEIGRNDPITITDTVYQLNSLISGKTYLYRIRARNADGAGLWSIGCFFNTLSTGKGTGLNGTYFNSADLTEIVATRQDQTISFNWMSGPPMPLITGNQFSVRWQGQIEATFSGVHTFTIPSHGGVRLWINNSLLLDQWDNEEDRTFTCQIRLEQIQRYPFRMEFCGQTGAAKVQLYWSGEDLPAQIVPSKRLYPVDVAQAWAIKAAMPSARESLCAVPLNGKIYAIGGADDSSYGAEGLTTVEAYNPESDTWETKAPMLTKRRYFAATAYNGRIYVFGGFTKDLSATTSIEMYDPVQNNWTMIGNMPGRRAGLSAVALEDKIYLIGGVGGWETGNPYGEGPLKVTEEFDPITRQITRKADMCFARNGVTAVAAGGGKVYAMGGTGTTISDNPRPIEMYDPVQDVWSVKANMLTVGSGSRAATVNRSIYVFGGALYTSYGYSYKKNVEVYHIDKNIWETKESLPMQLTQLAVAQTQGKVYLFGGWESASSSRVNSVYEYSPQIQEGALKSLSVSFGKLTPEFDPNVLGYSVVLPYGAPMPAINPVAANSSYIVSTTYPEKVPGTARINVKSEDGLWEWDYTISFVWEYSINSAVFTDEKKIPLNKLHGIGMITFSAVVVNSAEEEKSLGVSVALLDEKGVLSDIKYMETMNLPPGGNLILEVPIGNSEDVQGCSVKVFFWDDLNLLHPISDYIFLPPKIVN